MIGLLQRVSHANVVVDDVEIGKIGNGLLVLLGVEKHDTPEKADKLIRKILDYRVFEDEQGKMNLSLKDIKGDLLIVPQFTLAADTKSGLRPSFSSAANPEKGKELFDYVVEKTGQVFGQVQTGRFGADMKVELLNDGPVTFWLQVD